MRRRWARIAASSLAGLACALPSLPFAAEKTHHTPAPRSLENNAPWADWAQCLDSAAPLPCAQQRESRLLLQHPSRIRREGLRLMGLWPGQPPAVLADDSSPGSAPPGQHSVRVSVLVGPLTAAKDGWVIAHWERAEGMPRYTLAHAGPASPLPLAGLPWPAPHGRLFVTVSEALGTAASAGARVDLWQRTGPRWSRLLHYEAPAGLHLRFKAWRADGSALRLAWATDPAGCSQANSSPASGELQLRDGPYGWDFLPSPPQPCGP